MWFIRRMMRISWTEKKSKELVLKEANLERSRIKTIRQRQLQFLGHICRHKELKHLAINGKIEGKRSRGRQRITFIENLKSWAVGKGSNNNFIWITENRYEWRNMIANVCSRQGHADSTANICPDDVVRTGSKFLKVLDDKCYQFFVDPALKKPYREAQITCNQYKGNLAMPKTEKINQFLVDSLLDYNIIEEVFIGLDNLKNAKEFMWADGKNLKLPGFYENFQKDIEMFRPSRYSTATQRPKTQSNECVVLDPVKDIWRIWRKVNCRRDMVQRLLSLKNKRLFICEYGEDDKDDADNGVGRTGDDDATHKDTHVKDRPMFFQNPDFWRWPLKNVFPVSDDAAALKTAGVFLLTAIALRLPAP
ncbi:endonuclease-reverse transcriptase [Plakobranchus ocellatus]|uniref:Endonuclease-reverse transcriptase n=1 Tax=Plakobranchus ocellatus TaxID=259542 RepID=A0AAV4AYT0_9GAST|nr:endonuclease-reverse transcriptase [Plakobranchus ocellatus]